MLKYIAFLFMVVFTASATAQSIRSFSYQGQLLTDGQPATGIHEITIQLYDAPAEGSIVHTESFKTEIQNGIFNVAVGSEKEFPATLKFDKQYWLGIRIDGGAELSPRTPLRSVPYSVNAGSAQSLAKGATGAVTSLNGLSGDVTFQGGPGTFVEAEGRTITITSMPITSGGQEPQGAKWDVTGNMIGAGDFLGTLNNFPLEFRANNIIRMLLNQNYSIQRDPTGNARGQESIDLQTSRSNVTQVASGDLAVLAGGAANTASGAGSVVSGGGLNNASGFRSSIGGGDSNLASGSWSKIAGGSNNTSSGMYSFLGGGEKNIASGNHSVVVGGGGTPFFSSPNIASGDHASILGGSGNSASGSSSTVGGGNDNVASGNNTAILGGRRASASLSGQQAHANGAFGNAGDAQTSVFVLRRVTNTGAVSELFLDGFSDRITINPNMSVRFHAQVVGMTQNGANVGSYELTGCISRDNANNTTIVGTVNQTDVDETAGAIGWDATTIADNANEALVIQVTGAASTTIRWVARVETSEVSFP